VSEYQDKYWREMDQLKTHTIYLELYLEDTISKDRYLNMFLAIASSGSIATWAFWQEHTMVWAGIIAASQVAQAIKPFLPYTKRLKAMTAVTNDLEALFISMETHWFDVYEYKLSDEDIHKLHMSFKEKKRQILQKHLGSESVSAPHEEKYKTKAQSISKSYFTSMYPA
jgi:hypothetical protein